VLNELERIDLIIVKDDTSPSLVLQVGDYKLILGKDAVYPAKYVEGGAKEMDCIMWDDIVAVLEERLKRQEQKVRESECPQ
jgi:hypothetical protein